MAESVIKAHFLDARRDNMASTLVARKRCREQTASIDRDTSPCSVHQCGHHARRYFEQALPNDRTVRDLVVTMSTLCAACGVDVPDFTAASDLTGTEFRKLGMSLVNQLPGEAMTAMLPDHWAPAHPKQVLVHRIEESRQVANRKRDDRQKRREKSPPLMSAPQRIGEPERRWNEWVPRTLTYFFLPYGSTLLNSLLSTYTFIDDSILTENEYAFVSITD